MKLAPKYTRGKQRPGQLKDRATFYSPVEAKDEYGAVRQDWKEEFTRWANLEYRSGGEEVMAARMTGTDIANLTVRLDSSTKRIKGGWKVTVGGADYNIRGDIQRINSSHEYGFLLIQSGVAI